MRDGSKACVALEAFLALHANEHGDVLVSSLDDIFEDLARADSAIIKPFASWRRTLAEHEVVAALTSDLPRELPLIFQLCAALRRDATCAYTQPSHYHVRDSLNLWLSKNAVLASLWLVRTYPVRKPDFSIDQDHNVACSLAGDELQELDDALMCVCAVLGGSCKNCGKQEARERRLRTPPVFTKF